MGAGRWVRRSVAAAATASLVLLLTGCFTGDGAVSDFTREFSNDPAVSRLDLSSADNMPFTGGVGGTVYLHDGIDQVQVAELSDRVSRFGDDDRVHVDLAFDEWRIPVLSEPRSNTDLLDLVGEVRADPRVQGGTISSSDYDADIDHITVVSSAATDIRPLFDEVPALLADVGMTPTLTVRLPDGLAESVEFSGRPGAWVDVAFTAYDAIRSDLSLTAFSATESTIKVTLTAESDVDRARSMTDDALAGSGIEAVFASDLVTLAPGARGDEARALLAALDATARASILSVWTDDSTSSLTLASLTDVDRAATGVADASTTLDTVTLIVGAPDAPVLRLTSEPPALAADAATALALLNRDEVEALRVQPGHSMRLEFAATPTDADIARAAVSLKSLSRSGERVCVESPGGTFCIDAATTISAADGAANTRAFIDAWNAAPSRR